MRAIPLALVLTLTLVLVAPPALATCYNCNEGGASTSCVTTDFPTEAEGIVIMWYWLYTWRGCFRGYLDGQFTPTYCTDAYQGGGEVVAKFVPPSPAKYSIGMFAEGQVYEVGRGWITDSSAMAIEDCYGFCTT
jgi:hypothetical protein